MSQQSNDFTPLPPPQQTAQLNTTQTIQSPLEISRSIVELLAGAVAGRGFAVKWWDGSLDAPLAPRWTLTLGHPGALRRMLMPPTELALAEAFIRKDWDADDLGAALGMQQLFASASNPAKLARLVPLLRSLPTDDLPAAARLERPKPGLSSGRLHSKAQDASDVRSHYDLGNEFYQLFLDDQMVYSCAYFQTPDVSLHAAQTAKLELICRKLRLHPNERLLDIGCGWGGLLIHAARHHGVRGTGITLSLRQAELARERVKEAGLEDRITIEVMDYRDVPAATPFDKIVSVGMVEHVGRANIRSYFKAAHRLLAPGGVFLCHSIVEIRTPPALLSKLVHALTWRNTSFLHHYIFPGGEAPYPSELLSAAESEGFEARDLESLREHYALTAQHWAQRLEDNQALAITLVGEPTYRTYRLYLRAVIRTFQTRVNGLNQILLSKPFSNGSSGLPLKRTDWYEPLENPIAND